jgi:Skp family chaperone for outer membrane proteins
MNKNALFQITLFTLSFIFLGSVNVSAFAEDYVVATVDTARIINESADAKKAKIELDAQMKKSKILIEEKQNALKPLDEKAKKGEIKPGTKEGEEIKAKTRELVELMRTKEDEMQKLFSKYQADITEKTIKIVSAYAKEKDISLVLDKSSGASRGGVLFGTDTLDITAEIISRFNK